MIFEMRYKFCSIPYSGFVWNKCHCVDKILLNSVFRLCVEQMALCSQQLRKHTLCNKCKELVLKNYLFKENGKRRNFRKEVKLIEFIGKLINIACRL